MDDSAQKTRSKARPQELTDPQGGYGFEAGTKDFQKTLDDDLVSRGERWAEAEKQTT